MATRAAQTISTWDQTPQPNPIQTTPIPPGEHLQSYQLHRVAPETFRTLPASHPIINAVTRFKRLPQDSLAPGGPKCMIPIHQVAFQQQLMLTPRCSPPPTTARVPAPL